MQFYEVEFACTLKRRKGSQIRRVVVRLGEYEAPKHPKARNRGRASTPNAFDIIHILRNLPERRHQRKEVGYYL